VGVSAVEDAGSRKEYAAAFRRLGNNFQSFGAAAWNVLSPVFVFVARVEQQADVELRNAVSDQVYIQPRVL
jgi:hypothetical protein